MEVGIYENKNYGMDDIMNADIGIFAMFEIESFNGERSGPRAPVVSAMPEVMRLMQIHAASQQGLITSLWECGPATPEELAHRTGSSVSTVRTWLKELLEARVLEIDDENAPRFEIRYRLPARMGALLVEMEHPLDLVDHGMALAA
jgi:DNA-binding transcriptional ArsR family regulator